MTDRDQLLSRVRRANPAPAGWDLPATLADARPPMAWLAEARGTRAGRAAVRRGWRVPAIVAAALGITLAVAVPLLLIGRGGEGGPVATTPPGTTVPPTTTTSEPPSTTSTTPTSTTVPATPANLEMTWVQAPTQDAFGLDDGVWSIIQGGPGLVAVGVVGDAAGFTDGAVWVSADGTAWEKVGDPSAFVGVPTAFGTDMNQVLLDVAAGPGGYVAVGWVDRDTGDAAPPVWYSPDGYEWERLSPAAGIPAEVWWLGTVLSDADGFLAVGQGAWRSSDGRSWTRVDDGSLGVEYMDLVALAATPSGYAYLTTESVEGSGGSLGNATVYTSADAVSWNRALPTVESSTGTGLGVAGDRLVVLGFDALGTAAWGSDDGVAWERLGDLSGPERTLFPLGPVGDGDRWVVGGMEYTGRPVGAGVVFASADGGVTWFEVATFEDSSEGLYGGAIDQRPPGMRDLIRFGGGFVAVGGTGNGSAPVWIGAWTRG